MVVNGVTSKNERTGVREEQLRNEIVRKKPLVTEVRDEQLMERKVDMKRNTLRIDLHVLLATNGCVTDAISYV